MKKIVYIFAAVAALILTASCQKEAGRHMDDIVGDWHYSAEESGVKEDIWISFAADGTFGMYQKIGEGRHRKYTGNWSMEGNVLSGSYSDDTAWGSSYNVTFDGDSKMILTATEDSRESYTYSRESIPDEIRDGSVEVKASCDILNSQPQYRWL